MGWTVVYSTLEHGVESFTMTSFHDGKAAWGEALLSLRARFGSDDGWTLLVLVKGMNPTYAQ